MKMAFDGASRRDMCHTQSVRQAATSGPNVSTSLATAFGIQSAVRAEPCMSTVYYLSWSFVCSTSLQSVSCLHLLPACSSGSEIGNITVAATSGRKRGWQRFLCRVLGSTHGQRVTQFHLIHYHNINGSFHMHSKAAQVMRAHCAELQVGFRRVRADGKVPLRSTLTWLDSTKHCQVKSSKYTVVKAGPYLSHNACIAVLTFLDFAGQSDCSLLCLSEKAQEWIQLPLEVWFVWAMWEKRCGTKSKNHSHFVN